VIVVQFLLCLVPSGASDDVMKEEGDLDAAGKIEGSGDIKRGDAEGDMDKVKGADEVKEAGVVNGDVVAPLAKQEDEELSSVEEQLELGDDDWPDSIGEYLLVLQWYPDLCG